MAAETWISKAKLLDLDEVKTEARNRYISTATNVLEEYMQQAGKQAQDAENDSRVVQAEAQCYLAELALELAILQEAEALGIPQQRTTNSVSNQPVA